MIGPALVVALAVGGDAVPAGFRSPFSSVREEARREVVLRGADGRTAALAGLADADYRVRRLALDALSAIAGAEDLPSIAAAFRDRDAGVRVVAAGAYVATRARARDGADAAQEARSRGALDADVAEALRRTVRSRLLALFDGPNAKRWTWDRRFDPIASLGRAAAPALREAASDSQLAPSVRASALVALARLGDRADVPFLASLGKRETTRARRPSDIEEQMEDPPGAVAAGLALLGTTDPDALAVLTEMSLHGSYAFVRSWALWGLMVAAEELDAAGRDAIAATASRVFEEEGDPAVLDTAAQILGWIGKRTDVPALVDAIEHERGGYAAYGFLQAAWTLTEGEAPPGTPEAQTRAAVRAAFEKVAAHGLPPTAAFARASLGTLDAARADLVVRLKRLVEGRESTEEGDSYDYGPRRGCEALALLRETSAVPLLLAQCENQSDEIRQAAALALGAIADPAALPALRARLRDANEFTRVLVARDLLGLGEREAIATLVDALDGGNVWVRRRAIELLAPLRGGDADGYDPAAPPATRREPTARWRAWWRDRGAALRWDAGTKTFRE
jgi:HEAT repeat protein